MLKVYELSDRILAHTENAAHGMEVPPNARLLFCNGQVGARLDGHVPNSPREQLDVTFERIGAILDAADMAFGDVVKFTVYVTGASYFQDFFDVRKKVMGAHNPPATLLIVSRFPRPGVVLEVEAIAAKSVT